MRAPLIPDIHRAHFLDCAPHGHGEGHKLARLWRRWRREGLRATGRVRTPPTDAMCLSYHGGWVSYRIVYVQTRNGKRVVGKLYDKAPPPPLTPGQRQRLERCRETMREAARALRQG